ncbi:ECF transporter S component [Tersicoccus sp. MR15.9]|uniref:ECF transporter S component n=1 Tax=Tersicoccus mangrovi TaxID=3121635 RepID=UPI002FE69A58
MSTSRGFAPAAPATAQRGWRVIDIIVASVVAVACGVVFWAWSQGYAAVAVATAPFPFLGGLYGGGWLIAGVIGGLIIRKPGAALYCELIGACVEGVLGTHFGLTVILSGLIQGLGAEAVFALFRYRRFGVGVAMLAGLVSGLVMGISEDVLYNVEWAAGWQVVYAVLAGVSGLVIAGLVSWLIVRALAGTGVLSGLASGRAARARV